MASEHLNIWHGSSVSKVRTREEALLKALVSNSFVLACASEVVEAGNEYLYDVVLNKTRVSQTIEDKETGDFSFCAVNRCVYLGIGLTCMFMTAESRSEKLN